MHAVVATVLIEDRQVTRQALAGLRLNMVPRAPGFVSAYWLAPIDGNGSEGWEFEYPDHALLRVEDQPPRVHTLSDGWSGGRCPRKAKGPAPIRTMAGPN